MRHIPNQIDAALRYPWQVRALAIVDAVIVNVVILLVARVITGDFPRATLSGDEQSIGVPLVILSTVVAGVGATLSLGLLQRISCRGRTIWTGISVAVLLISLGGPLGGGVDTASKIVLALLHIGTAATIIPLMLREPASNESA